MVTAAIILKDICSLEEKIWQTKYYFASKSPYRKSYGFSVVIHGCESWTIKKAPKNWCLCTMVFEKTLRVLWTARRSNQSILNEISPEFSLEGLMLKLKLHYFGHLMRRADSLEKIWCWERLKSGGEGDDRGWDGWKAFPTRRTWVDGKGSLECCRPWGRRESDMTERLNWTGGSYNQTSADTEGQLLVNFN